MTMDPFSGGSTPTPEGIMQYALACWVGAEPGCPGTGVAVNTPSSFTSTVRNLME